MEKTPQCYISMQDLQVKTQTKFPPIYMKVKGSYCVQKIH